MQSRSAFLPINRKDMEARGWDECDFIFVSGDAYVDHPSFAAAMICRVLEAEGFRVGIIPQPAWQNPDLNNSPYVVLGRPCLAFLAGAGNLDSMVAHYTAAQKKRSEDAYSPGGKAGHRPDRALLKYVEDIRRMYKNVPVIIGGIEASLRRFAHYDYWSDTVRRSILLDSKADILVYGMGERAIIEIAHLLASGETIEKIQNVRGTCVKTKEPNHGLPKGAIELPGYETVKGRDEASLKAYAEHFMLQKCNSDPLSSRPLAEQSDGNRWVIQNPPAFPFKKAELDRLYELPFTRRSHPIYDTAGGIPALKEVTFSLVSSRGCFGGCSFCAINFHQGRAIQYRSKESLVREAKSLTKMQGFKGYIHDVGGPTANFYTPPCKKQEKGGFCTERECLFPSPCRKLKADHIPYLETLSAIRNASSKIKKVFIRSGIRFDFIQHDSRGGEFLETLCNHHISGQLKVAPEHICTNVLAAMGKTGDYENFRKRFIEANKKAQLKQFLLPYFISGHPGCGLNEAIDLALYLKKSGFVPDQVQDFYPTPGTLSTVMHHTGFEPRSGKSIHVPGEREKRLQRALLQFDREENRPLVRRALKEARREEVFPVLGGQKQGKCFT
ncbi:MAG: YgiQ family radical SAM protein [Treponema sp.]|nr:YgiQ family radical SAM protein [Treponema sp.]